MGALVGLEVGEAEGTLLGVTEGVSLGVVDGTALGADEGLSGSDGAEVTSSWHGSSS